MLKENYLKKELNNLREYDFEKISIPVQHISYANKGQGFDSIADLFNVFAYEFDTKINDIKDHIFNLPAMANNYDWSAFETTYNEIHKEIVNSKSSIKELFEIHYNLLSYRDYVSYLLVSYRENAWNLIHFYEKNLVHKNNKTKEIKAKIRSLRECADNLNQCIENYDINVIIAAIDNINFEFNELIKLVNHSYIIQKQSNYINYSINEIKTIISQKHQNIKSTIINNAQKAISKVENNRDYLLASVEKLSNKDIETISTSLIRKLSNIKKMLNFSFKSSEFFNYNKTDIDNAFRNMLQIIPSILGTFEKIYGNFIEDREIKTAISNCNALFCTIKIEIDKYFNISQKNNYNTIDLLELAKNIIEDIIEAITLADRIVLDVDKKYEYSKKILNDITSTKLVLTQMKAFIIENKAEEKNNIAMIDKLTNELDTIQKKTYIQKGDNLEYVFNQLSDTKSEISYLKLALIRKEKMKQYVEKIVNYSCLKMVNDEDLKLKIAKPVELYNQGLYYESILFLINQLKRI
ncbi:MAG: hypothetical protein HUJ42_02885 [Malacoplasma sp.]|nr:hypothetical protein [Malacoplasma sp.]